MAESTEQKISRIQKFLEGWGSDKGIVNVETNDKNAIAYCFIQTKKGVIIQEDLPYTNFLYIKDFSKFPHLIKTENHKLFQGEKYLLDKAKEKHCVELIGLKKNNHPRLIDGYCWLIKSTKSFNAIKEFLFDGGLLAAKGKQQGEKDVFNDITYKVSNQEQFFISTGNRLYKGIDEYSQLYKATFDIETTSLNPLMGRITHIGVKTNLNEEQSKNSKIFEVVKENDDEAEKAVIRRFLIGLSKITTPIICGYNSELFDFEFILKRAEKVGIEVKIDSFFNVKTYRFIFGENDHLVIKRRSNSSVKIGSSTDKYTSTSLWGKSVIDILHAVKRAAATNTEIKSVKLKDICKYAKIAKKDRMYVKDDKIAKTWRENKVYVVNCATNEYVAIPDELQLLGIELHKAQQKDESGKCFVDPQKKKEILTQSKPLVEFLVGMVGKYPTMKFMRGGEIVTQYLYDDLWETEQVDLVYNQSSFMLAKLVPTTYPRICTMGTAAVWNLLMTTWSYENRLAIPVPDVKEKFSGGLARCYKKGWSRRIRKVDFNALYPMLQLTYDIFPSVDVTGVLKDILLYLTLERNKFKALKKKAEKDGDSKLANFYDAKQSPIKILNNSFFGALGSNIAFHWGDNVCAAGITCRGRGHLRGLTNWVSLRGCVPLLAVTDGLNFSYPEMTSIDLDGNLLEEVVPIEKGWVYGNKTGVEALIEKYNAEELPKPYMKIDDDGSWYSSLNLSRINYANLTEEKIDGKTGEIIPKKIKLTGNTIKSKVMPEYIEDFINKGLMLILEGKGKEFVEYYYGYVETIFYQQIPLKKIATKKKYKNDIKTYLGRGNDKTGRKKAKMAHMELMLEQRHFMAIEEYVKRGLHTTDIDLVQEYYDNRKKLLEWDLLRKLKNKNGDQSAAMAKLTEELKIYNKKIDDIFITVEKYLLPEPEIGTTLYYVNIGIKKGHADSQAMLDEKTNRPILCSELIDGEQIEMNPELKGKYNVAKYLEAFNTRIKKLLEGFDQKVAKKLIIKDPKDRQYFTDKELELTNYDADLLSDSMFLEELEIDFWNRTGLNPHEIYSGIKIPEDYPLFIATYDEKFDLYKPLFDEKYPNSVLKKIRDKDVVEGDYVFVKNYNKYDLYLHNGIKPLPHELNLKLELTEQEIVYQQFIEDRKKPINADQPHDFLITKMMDEKQIKQLEKWCKKFKKYFELPKDDKLSEIQGDDWVENFEKWLEMEGLVDATEDDIDEELVEEVDD